MNAQTPKGRHPREGGDPGAESVLDSRLRWNDDPVNARTLVCRLEDIVPNTGVCALIGGRQIAVFRLDDDSLHALDNYDPFSRANVLSRGIVGDVKGEVVVASPVYKQHFSLATGRCLEDPSVGVPVYEVRLEGDRVCVNVPQREQLQAA